MSVTYIQDNLTRGKWKLEFFLIKPVSWGTISNSFSQWSLLVREFVKKKIKKNLRVHSQFLFKMPKIENISISDQNNSIELIPGEFLVHSLF